MGCAVLPLHRAVSRSHRTAPGKWGTHGKHKLLLSLSLVKVTLFPGSGNSALQCHLVSCAQSGSEARCWRSTEKQGCVVLSRVRCCHLPLSVQLLLVHSHSIFYAAKHLVPLAGSDLVTTPKKQQKANSVSHWVGAWAPGRGNEWSSLQRRKSLPASHSLIPVFGRDTGHPV